MVLTIIFITPLVEDKAGKGVEHVSGSQWAVLGSKKQTVAICTGRFFFTNPPATMTAFPQTSRQAMFCFSAGFSNYCWKKPTAD